MYNKRQKGEQMITKTFYYDKLVNHQIYALSLREFTFQERRLKRQYSEQCMLLAWTLFASILTCVIFELTMIVYWSVWWIHLIAFIISVVIFVLFSSLYHNIDIFKYRKYLINPKLKRERYLKVLILELLAKKYQLVASDLRNVLNQKWVILCKEQTYLIFKNFAKEYNGSFADIKYIELNRALLFSGKRGD